MSEHHVLDDQPVTVHLHPLVHVAMGVMALFFVLAAWAFSGDSYAAYLIAAVTGLFVVGGGLYLILWHEWDKYHAGREDEEEHTEDQDPGAAWSFGKWARSEFEEQRSRERGSTAAVESLAPIAAVGIGMVLLVLTVHIFNV